MKKSYFLLASLFLSLSASAAPTSGDQKTLYMISDIIKACPNEFTQSLEQHEDILSINLEHSKNALNLSVTTLIMTTGYAATPMSPKAKPRSQVTVVKTAKGVQPLDAWLEDTKCSLTQF